MARDSEIKFPNYEPAMQQVSSDDQQQTPRNRLELCLRSELESVDLGEALLRQFSQIGKYTDQQQEEISLAVRECLANAVIHGNQYEAGKKVLLTAELDERGLAISVRDEGPGFDPDSLPDPRTPEHLLMQSGRGVLLVKSLMDEVTLRRLPSQGMEVILKKHWKSTLMEEHKMSLKINNRKVDGVTVLDLSGRLVLGEATSLLRETLKDLVGGGEKNILLNLADVSYIDSSGLGALVGGYTSVTSQQGQMKLVNLNTKVHDLLRVTKLVTVFEVHDDEGKAVKSFA